MTRRRHAFPAHHWGRTTLTLVPRRTVLRSTAALGLLALGAGRATAVQAADPPPTADAPVLNRLAALGVTPGSTPSTGPSAAALAAGVTAGNTLLAVAARTTPSGTWSTSPNLGAYGTDYLLRAATARRALAANLPAESLYYTSGSDVLGDPLTGTRAYRLALPAPPPCAATGFWSFTMYGEDMFLVDNPIDRYAIGDRTEGLARAADGSLDLYVGATAPTGHESNWLPAPPGPFVLMARIYSPTEAALSGTWHPPAFQPL